MPKAKRNLAKNRILKVTIKRMVDDSPDTSWLGEYSNTRKSEFSIDRAHADDCNSVVGDGAKFDRIAAYVEKLAQEEQDCFGDSPEFEALNSAYDELSQIADSFDDCDCGEHGDMSRNECRYFNPSFNYVDKNGKATDTPENVRKYVRQDYERMERLNRGDWCFMGIRAEARIGVQIGVSKYTREFDPSLRQTITSGGLWGIESDSDRTYLESVEQDELADLKAQLLALGFSKRAIATAFKNVERKDS